MNEAATLAKEVGVVAACDALGVARSAVYRRYRAHRQPPAKDPPRPRPRPPRALSEDERTDVITTLRTEPYVDQAPRQVWASLLEAGRYLCSVRTMYRILHAHGEIRERRNLRRHPKYVRPELLATAPSQLWSWDITLLRGPSAGIYYRLYVMIDVFSRYVVGWQLAERESTNRRRRAASQRRC